ncbi:BRO family protein [Streptomyces sp. C10-9-1]|uniref:BRO family protein n=1 Tax=Streptomyces sp. C10-9-1 TaxID=1859285 RepID=UPI003D75FE14
MSIVPFSFPDTGQAVRTLMVEGEPWFVAADVCAVLDIANVGNALARLDEDERGSIRLADGTPGNPNRAVVNEPGLYSLVLRSDKPEARAFKRWITHEVLPAIRRAGQYAPLPSLEDPLAALEQQTTLTRRAIELAKAERARAVAAETRAAALEPDAARARRTLDAEGLALVGTVAKRFGIREKALRGFLYDEELLIRSGARRNEPYARWVASGHFEVKTRLVGDDLDRPPVARSTTYVSPKGEDLIWARLHRAGLVAAPVPPIRQLELT